MMRLQNFLSYIATDLSVVRFHAWPRFRGPFPDDASFIASQLFGFIGDILAVFVTINQISLLVQDPTQLARSLSKRLDATENSPPSMIVQLILALVLIGGGTLCTFFNFLDSL